MTEQQKQITFDLFKENIVFIVITSFVVLFLVVPSQLMKPVYSSYAESVIGALVAYPIFALWMMHFWNKILVKLFPNISSISYGVSLMLSVFLSMLM